MLQVAEPLLLEQMVIQPQIQVLILLLLELQLQLQVHLFNIQEVVMVEVTNLLQVILM